MAFRSAHERHSHAALAAVLLVLLQACGAADQVRTERDEAPEAPMAAVRTNVCPIFEASFVLPQLVPADASAFVAVRATDPDADDLRLTYDWSATAGEFSEPTLPLTEYRCLEPGDQVLTAIATDLGDCGVAIHIDVTCAAD